MANKVTKREVINGLMDGSIAVDSETAQAYFKHELELLDAKTSKRKSAKEKPENVALYDRAEEIVAEADGPLTTTEIGNKLGISTSKATSVMSMVVERGTAYRGKLKDKTVYTREPLAEEKTEKAE